MNAPQVLLYEDDPEAALAQATAALNSGQCIVYPTDTVYGLVGHCESTAAYRRIFELKGRSTDQPLALLVHPAQPAAGAAEGALAGEPALLEQFQSGALTVVLDEKQLTGIPAAAREIQPGPVGLRRPVDERTRELLAACGGLVWATSVNASSQPPAATAGEVHLWLESIGLSQRPLAVLSAVPLRGSASAVVRLTGAGPLHLR